VIGLNQSQINAYAAGLIDGEGCISIAGYKNKTGNTYAARIDVGMSSKARPVLAWLQQHFGGSIRKTRDQSERWEEAYAWAVFGKGAHTFLLAVQPYLILKAEQARLAVRLQEMIAESGWTSEARRRGETIRQRMQELNRKGPDTSSIAPGWFARLAGGIWVTPQSDMFTDLGWASFSQTWLRAGMVRRGAAYPLPVAERPIAEIESSLWPTMTVFDSHGVTAIRTNPKAGALTLTQRVGGELNPTWVEWLMGFPEGWTDLGDSETP
jgi:hypothetical protein